ncbi:RNA polymerase sigma factor [Hyphomicrobium sp. D-2]|uniref:RNA polymerase sigma factor n=1 Tax=Hyphomicrobium sp. D-2 TaxID=3041621 RepID=UPI002455D6BB|nr:RNA polymerase sigma factor [Hyphomicrobium sp. D-2]MDH4982125.1 RNA polymerase sigma factor [Hyphomicrobium sp. D-2]
MSGPALSIFSSSYGELRSFALRKVGSISIAEELVQEACLRLTAMMERDRIENPRAFLFHVIGNLIIDYQRRENTRARHEGVVSPDYDCVDEGVNVEAQVAARQELALLSEAIAELPPRCRECFIMRRFENRSQAEIAERMGITRGMVEKHLRYAAEYCTRRLWGDE